MQITDIQMVEVLRLYLSGLVLLHKGQVVWQEPQSYHLLDAAEPASLLLRLSVPAGLRYNALRFCVGIDSATNTAGAMGGDLDPTKGMYWTWHSGYINFKLEGSSPACPTRKNAFQFHVGGYQAPHSALQQVELPLQQSPQTVIRADLAPFFSKLDLRTQHSLMRPGPEAVQLAKLISRMFYVAHAP